MRYSGIQPHYFPRLHYFARILQTDIFMIRDEAQFVRKHKYPDGNVGFSYQAHTPMKQSTGLTTLSFSTKHDGLKPIATTAVAYENDWPSDHLKTLTYAYAKAPNFSILYNEIAELLFCKPATVGELNIATILWGIAHLLGEHTITAEKRSLAYITSTLASRHPFRLQQIRLSSQSPALTNGQLLTANEKIVALCKEVGATEDYCGGTGHAAYIDEQVFKDNDIAITIQDWQCQRYPQQFMRNQGFLPNLSIIDLLMHTSTKEAQKIILG